MYVVLTHLEAAAKNAIESIKDKSCVIIQTDARREKAQTKR